MKTALIALTMILGLGSAASAARGVFCNERNQIVQWVCQEYPNGPGWVPQPNGCFQRLTNQSCNGGYNPHPGPAPIPVPPPPPPPQGRWIFCAREGEVCRVPGYAQVRYGSMGYYNYLNIRGEVPCMNQYFGDPAKGYEKTCEFFAR